MDDVFGFYYEDSWEPVSAVDFTVEFIDQNHLTELAEKLRDELVPKLDFYKFELNTPETLQRIHNEVDAYFIDQWIVHTGHDVTVEVGPDNGLIVTAFVLYQNDDTGDFDSSIDFEISHQYRVDFSVPAMEIGDVEKAVDGDMTVPQDQPRSPEDILFEPIISKPPAPVKDDYDDFLYECLTCTEDQILDQTRKELLQYIRWQAGSQHE